MQNPPKKYPICAWKLSLNEGNYAFKIDGGRQKDRQTDRKTDGETERQTMLLKRSFAPNNFFFGSPKRYMLFSILA